MFILVNSYVLLSPFLYLKLSFNDSPLHTFHDNPTIYVHIARILSVLHSVKNDCYACSICII